MNELAVVTQAFPSLLAQEVEVWRGGSTTHVASYYACSTATRLGLQPAGGWYGEKLPRGASTAKVTAQEALEGCAECLGQARADAFESLEGWYEASRLVSAAKRAKSIKKVNGSTSASAIAKRRTELTDLLGVAKDARNSASAEVRAKADDVLEELTKADEVLRSLSSDPETVRKVEEKVKALMVPKRFVGTVVLDSTPHLVGISRLPWRVSSQVQAAIDAFAIRNDASVIVLLAPAYVYAFLLQQLFSRASDVTLVVGYPAPEEAEVREVAAGVWDPEGASAQACMMTAIETARALA
jgi:hypothetical protein